MPLWKHAAADVIQSTDKYYTNAVPLCYHKLKHTLHKHWYCIQPHLNNINVSSNDSTKVIIKNYIPIIIKCCPQLHLHNKHTANGVTNKMDDNYNTSTIRQKQWKYTNNYKHNKCMVLNELFNITQAMNSSNVYWYSTPSPFTGITFL